MVYARQVPLHVLQKAWNVQAKNMGHNTTWGQVTGPAGAVQLLLRRLGWRAHSATSWATGNGMVLDLTDTSPKWDEMGTRRGKAQSS
eukprot:3543505-Pyramimonas_sp.AAC.1